MAIGMFKAVQDYRKRRQVAVKPSQTIGLNRTPIAGMPGIAPIAPARSGMSANPDQPLWAQMAGVSGANSRRGVAPTMDLLPPVGPIGSPPSPAPFVGHPYHGIDSEAASAAADYAAGPPAGSAAAPPFPPVRGPQSGTAFTAGLMRGAPAMQSPAVPQPIGLRGPALQAPSIPDAAVASTTNSLESESEAINAARNQLDLPKIVGDPNGTNVPDSVAGGMGRRVSNRFGDELLVTPEMEAAKAGNAPANGLMGPSKSRIKTDQGVVASQNATQDLARAAMGLRRGTDLGTATESAGGAASRVQRKGMIEGQMRGGWGRPDLRKELRSDDLRAEAVAQAGLNRQNAVDVAAAGARHNPPRPPLVMDQQKVVDGKVVTEQFLVDQDTGTPIQPDMTADQMQANLDAYIAENTGSGMFVRGKYIGRDSKIKAEIDHQQALIDAKRKGEGEPRTFGSVDEAQRAGLSVGTEIVVNGCRAVVE